MTSTEQAGSDLTKATPDQLKVLIEHTREELGVTIEALTAKLDVKARAKERVGRARDEAVGQLHAAGRRATAVAQEVHGRANAAAAEGPEPRVLILVAVATATVTVLAVGVWRWRHE